MEAKTVSERTHEGTQKVAIVERDGALFAIDYSGMKMMNLGNRRNEFSSAQEAQKAADLAVDLTGHRCYWGCSAWS